MLVVQLFGLKLDHTLWGMDVGTAAAASLCVRAKGAIISMPERQAVLKILVNHIGIEQEMPLPDEHVLQLLEEHTLFPHENTPGTSSQVEEKMQLMQIQLESVTV
jgi:hypothetical protein